MLDSIIFDIDGTLQDSRRQVQIAWKNEIERLTGKPWEMSFETFTGLFGMTMDSIAARLFPEDDREEQLRKADLCYEAENRWLYDHPADLFPGVRETLEELAKTYPLYIVSNCQCGYIEATVISQKLEHLFKGSLCFGDTGAPKGVTIRTLADREGLKHPVYVGDIQGDADASAMAEVPFVYAEYGFGQVDKPDYTIHDFSELPALCASIAQEGDNP